MGGLPLAFHKTKSPINAGRIPFMIVFHMAKSVKVNYVFNLINTAVGLLFPIVTFPYVTRVVMAEGLGRVQFLSSIINYITLLTALGIPLYAVREIARVRDNITERNKTTMEILILHVILCLVGYAIVFILGITVTKIYNDIGLFLLLSLHIILSAIGVSWFYQGVEDFGYITIRSLIVRLLCLIALFTLVKSKDDLYIYAGVQVFSEVGNYLFNFFHLKKYISLKDIPWKELNFKRHLPPALKIFVLNLITSIYVNLDSVMLGFLSTNVAVGFYSSVTRLTKALLGIVGTLGSVLLPRLSNYVYNGNIEAFKSTSNKAYNFILTMAIPMVFGLVISAPELIKVMCGSEFAPAISTMQIVAPIVLFIGASSFVGLQVLYSQGKENLVVISTLVGAIINFTLNWILIPHWAQDGAAIATTLAEFSVITTMFIIGRRYIPFNALNKTFLQISIFSLLMVIPLFLVKQLPYSVYILFLLEILVATTIYLLLLLITKNEFLTLVFENVKKRINK